MMVSWDHGFPQSTGTPFSHSFKVPTNGCSIHSAGRIRLLLGFVSSSGGLMSGHASVGRWLGDLLTRLLLRLAVLPLPLCLLRMSGLCRGSHCWSVASSCWVTWWLFTRVFSWVTRFLPLTRSRGDARSICWPIRVCDLDLGTLVDAFPAFFLGRSFHRNRSSKVSGWDRDSFCGFAALERGAFLLGILLCKSARGHRSPLVSRSWVSWGMESGRLAHTCGVFSGHRSPDSTPCQFTAK
jgi:hypothetical protein